MTKKTILIIEDEPDILELVEYNLQREGFVVVTASTGEEGLQKAGEVSPDLIVLDLMLPDISGIEVCSLLRKKTERRVPIIMETARDSEADVVLGLEMGADDYLTKPFSVRELSARIRAVLRRSSAASVATEDVIRAGPLALDKVRHEARLGGEQIHLTLAEFRLLSALAATPGKVFTRDQLLDHITGGEATIVDRNVDVHIRSLRRKLGPFASLIVTVRGVGYKCEVPPVSASS